MENCDIPIVMYNLKQLDDIPKEELKNMIQSLDQLDQSTHPVKLGSGSYFR